MPMAASGADVEGTLEEVNRLLRRLEVPDGGLHHGGGVLSVTLRGVADAQARLFRLLDFRLQGHEHALAEIRQQAQTENSRRGARFVELTEILAGHGGVLAELQQHQKEEPHRRQALLAELSTEFQVQEKGVNELAERFDNVEAVVRELRHHASEVVAETQQLRTSEGEVRSRLSRCKEEVVDLWRVYEEMNAKQNTALAKLHDQLQQPMAKIQKELQQQAASVAELQRRCAERQRSRVQRLEAEVAEVVSAAPSRENSFSPLTSATGPPPAVERAPSPCFQRGRSGSLIASTSTAILHERDRSPVGSSLSMSGVRTAVPSGCSSVPASPVGTSASSACVRTSVLSGNNLAQHEGSGFGSISASSCHGRALQPVGSGFGSLSASSCRDDSAALQPTSCSAFGGGDGGGGGSASCNDSGLQPVGSGWSSGFGGSASTTAAPSASFSSSRSAWAPAMQDSPGGAYVSMQAASTVSSLSAARQAHARRPSLASSDDATLLEGSRERVKDVPSWPTSGGQTALSFGDMSSLRDCSRDYGKPCASLLGSTLPDLPRPKRVTPVNVESNRQTVFSERSRC